MNSLSYSQSPQPLYNTLSLIQEKQKAYATTRKYLDFGTIISLVAALALYVTGAVLRNTKVISMNAGLGLVLTGVSLSLAGLAMRTMSVYNKLKSRDLSNDSPEIRKLFLNKVNPNNIDKFDFEDLERNGVITSTDYTTFNAYKKDLPEAQKVADDSAAEVAHMKAVFSSFKLSIS